MSQEQDLSFSDPDDTSSEGERDPGRRGSGSGSMSELLDSNTGPSAAIGNSRTHEMEWTDSLPAADSLLESNAHSDANSHPFEGLSDKSSNMDSHPNEGLIISGTSNIGTSPTEDPSAAAPAGHPSEDPNTTYPVSHPTEGLLPDIPDIHGHSNPDEQTCKGLSEQTHRGLEVEPSVEDKAKAYIKKKKGEQMAAIRLSLGGKLLTYEAINLSRRRKMIAPYLQSGGTLLDEGLENGGDFLSTGDGRGASMFMKVNLPKKMAMSFSFDPDKKICPFCPCRRNHPVLGVPLASSQERAEREAFLLGDQALPPLLPSSSANSCIRIIRLEFGSMHELVSILLELLEGRKLSPGSIIMIFSLSHIANVGVAAYIEDLVACRKRLVGALGGDIYVTAAPPLLLPGVALPAAIRDISSLHDWIEGGVAEEVLFKTACDEALEAISDNGYGEAQVEVSARLRTSANLSGGTAQKIWATGGNSALPNGSGPTTEEQESRVIQALVNDIKTKLALNLDDSPVTSRKLSRKESGGGDKLLVVGCSNAARLAAALVAKGVPSGSVICNGWRANKQSVMDMANHVRTELEGANYTAIIFQILDNNIYFARQEDGGLSPAKKQADGIYHVEGDLVVADKAAQLAILNMCKPLWDLAEDMKLVIMGPLPRYVLAGCCSAQGHVQNRSSANFYPKLRQELATVNASIKDYLFTSGRRNGRAMDPLRNLQGLSPGDIWGSDPIHPKKDIYSRLADGVRDVERSCGPGHRKRSAEDAGWGQGGRDASGDGGSRAGRDIRIHHSATGGPRASGSRGDHRGHGGFHSGGHRGGGGGERDPGDRRGHGRGGHNSRPWHSRRGGYRGGFPARGRGFGGGRGGGR